MLQKRKKKFFSIFKHLYVQVLLGIFVGIILGEFAPDIGVQMKPLVDIFIRLIKMIIAPIIFCTIVSGIAGMGDIKETGRVGLKAIIYFEIATTFALVIGLLAINLFKPGVGMNIDIAQLGDKSIIAPYLEHGKQQTFVEYIVNAIPNSIVSPFATGDMIQVLFISVLFGVALNKSGNKGEQVKNFLSRISSIFFLIVKYIIYIAPFAAFGAMAFTVGKFGTASLTSLWKLIAVFYFTCGVFILGVLGLACRMCGISIIKLCRYLKEELLIVFSASSSEPALPNLMHKLEKIGCQRGVVGLVVPAGYSFNLDGICIYLTLAAVFIAQALNIELTLWQQLSLLGVTLLTSKGSAGVTGAGFITLASTLSVIHVIPVEGLLLIIGVDRFMSEARALTSFIGNAVATLVVAKWEGELDMEKAKEILV